MLPPPSRPEHDHAAGAAAVERGRRFGWAVIDLDAVNVIEPDQVIEWHILQPHGAVPPHDHAIQYDRRRTPRVAQLDLPTASAAIGASHTHARDVSQSVRQGRAAP